MAYVFLDQWIIMISSSAKRQAPAWGDFKPLVPPPDRDWADPFLWIHEGRHYVFIEEMPYSTLRGHIACLELDDRFNVVSKQIVLERPYHLSYPFLFIYGEQLYMMPEAKRNHAIDIFRCVRFPDQWEYAQSVMKNIDAADATLLNKDGKWWLFTNVQEEGGSSFDTLHLFFAYSPLADRWIPHPLNPIVKDLRSARPAGHFLAEDGILIRPSQDCTVRYGYATNFNSITKMTETDYAERTERRFVPPVTGDIIGTHTWNEMENLVVIDAILRRWKFFLKRQVPESAILKSNLGGFGKGQSQ